MINRIIKIITLLLFPMLFIPLLNIFLYQGYLFTQISYEKNIAEFTLSSTIKNNINNYVFMDFNYSQKVEELSSKLSENNYHSTLAPFFAARKQLDNSKEMELNADILRQLDCELKPLSKMYGLNLASSFKDFECLANITLKESFDDNKDMLKSILLIKKAEKNYIIFAYDKNNTINYCVCQAVNSNWNLTPLDGSWRMILHSEAIDFYDYNSFIFKLPGGSYLNGFFASHKILTRYIFVYLFVLLIELVLYFVSKKNQSKPIRGQNQSGDGSNLSGDGSVIDPDKH